MENHINQHIYRHFYLNPHSINISCSNFFIHYYYKLFFLSLNKIYTFNYKYHITSIYIFFLESNQSLIGVKCYILESNDPFLESFWSHI